MTRCNSKTLMFLLAAGLSAAAGLSEAQAERKPERKPGAKPGAKPRPAPAEKKAAAKIVYGKYGCTATKYRGGSFEYVMRGSFVLAPGGAYTYFGFEKPSKGTYTVDAGGNLHFKGGYFDGGKAEKIDRPNKYFLVFPANADNRWTCGLVEG